MTEADRDRVVAAAPEPEGRRRDRPGGRAPEKAEATGEALPPPPPEARRAFDFDDLTFTVADRDARAKISSRAPGAARGGDHGRAIPASCFVVEQRDELWPYLTCRESMAYAAALYGAPGRDPDAHLDRLARVGADTLADKLYVVSTIHQPSARVFAHFSSVLLLSKGRTAYCGPADACLAHFEALGHAVPPHTSVAEFLLDAVNADFTDDAKVDAILDAWAPVEEDRGPRRSTATRRRRRRRSSRSASGASAS
ncbi:ATPase [Aureococcus anophagefferens]|nr:ATPase [Aureococcus anophagefferens]